MATWWTLSLTDNLRVSDGKDYSQCIAVEYCCVTMQNAHMLSNFFSLCEHAVSIYVVNLFKLVVSILSYYLCARSLNTEYMLKILLHFKTIVLCKETWAQPPIWSIFGEGHTAFPVHCTKTLISQKYHNFINEKVLWGPSSNITNIEKSFITQWNLSLILYLLGSQACAKFFFTKVVVF